MRWWWKRALMVGVLALLLAPTVVAKVTLDTCGNAEAIWWGHMERQPTCSPCPDCVPDLAVELGAFAAGEVAAVWLDTAERFTINLITQLGFRYMHIEHFGVFPVDPVGPALALALEWFDDDQYKQILAISDVAPRHEGPACLSFFGGNAWYYGTWDGQDLCSFVLDPSFDPLRPLPLSWSTLVSTFNGANPAVVMAVGAVMGLPTAPEPYNPTRAVVDDILIRWGANGSCGGVYDLEPEADDPSGLSLWPVPVTFDGDADDHGHLIRDAWARTGMWKFVESTQFDGEPLDVTEFPSQTWAAYFGNIDPKTGTGSYDNKGARTSGYLTSPCNFFNPGDERVDLGFEYYRLVESYQGGLVSQRYDRTWLEFRWIRWTELGGCPGPDYLEEWESLEATPSKVTYNPNTGDGRVLWYKDSSHPSEMEWTTWTLAKWLPIPCDAVGIQFRFGFDSMDGVANNHFGLLIDNFWKTHTRVPNCVEILTTDLPQATVKVDYEFFLEATPAGVEWEIVYPARECPDCGPLPLRLSLESRTGRIFGHLELESQGTYKILVRASRGPLDNPCNYDEKILVLAVRPPEGTLAPNTIYNQYFDPANSKTPAEWYDGAGWVRCGLWHYTSEVNYKGSDIVTDQYGTAAYFGQNDTTKPNYNTGTRAKCCLTSPWISIPGKFVGQDLIVGFKSWREVETYLHGAYDKTWVEVQFEGGPWQQIWTKDSRNPENMGSWTWEEILTGIEIPSGKKVRIQFCFDSVDAHNNNFVGWLVDEVGLYAGSAELTITTECPLPEATENQPYTFKFTATGGPVGNKVWQFIGQLPDGLDFDVASGTLSGTPRKPGNYSFTVKVTADDGTNFAEAQKACQLEVIADTILLFEDFDKDPVWSWTGLWHRTTNNGPTGVTGLSPANRAAYYGKDDTSPQPNYSTGARTTGALTLVAPVINLTGVPFVNVKFDYWHEVEPYTGGAYDFAIVQVKLDDGAWNPIWQRSSVDPKKKAWQKAEIKGVPTNGASTMLIRFVFDSIDKWHNNYVGFLVDNILVEKATTGGAQAVLSPPVVQARGVEIDFFNSPNPVRDVNTTTFAVRGVDAERIKVEIYDLAGRLVYMNEVPGSELVWHTQDVTGLPLANGVYLYKVYVKVGEAWVVSSVQKLTVLR